MNEKIHRVKTKESDADSGYLQEKLVGSEYINVTEEDIPDGTGKRLKAELDLSAVIEGAADGKVKVTTGDTHRDFLVAKILAGDDITVTSNNPTGNGNLTIATEGKLKTDSEDTHGYLEDKVAGGTFLTISSTTGTITFNVDSETTFTGLATKLPSSSAIKTLLRALTITNAENCGSGGDAIMYKTKDIDASRIMFIEGTDATAANIIDAATHYPLPSVMITKNPMLDDGGDEARGPFGAINLITAESPVGDPEFRAALINFMLEEDYISGEDIYLDVMLKLADSSDLEAETLLRAYPYYVKDQDAAITALTVVDKSISWNKNGADVFEWYTFTIGGVTSNTKPTAMNIFLACMSEDGTYDVGTETPVNNATIVQARIRYAKKTIQLPTTSVVL